MASGLTLSVDVPTLANKGSWPADMAASMCPPGADRRDSLPVGVLRTSEQRHDDSLFNPLQQMEVEVGRVGSQQTRLPSWVAEPRPSTFR